MPSVLVELGFLTNPKEEDFLNSEQGKSYMASAIYRAFKDYKNEQEGVLKDVHDVQGILNGENAVNSSSNENSASKGTSVESSPFLTVQVFSASSKLTSKKLKSLTAPFFYVENGLYKYCSGNFSNLENAKKHQKELVTLGFKDCFVLGFRNNKKLDIASVIDLLK
jgi:N-acetylmuramoyl-L-alanine amidase